MCISVNLASVNDYLISLGCLIQRYWFSKCMKDFLGRKGYLNVIENSCSKLVTFQFILPSFCSLKIKFQICKYWGLEKSEPRWCGHALHYLTKPLQNCQSANHILIIGQFQMDCFVCSLLGIGGEGGTRSEMSQVSVRNTLF